MIAKSKKSIFVAAFLTLFAFSAAADVPQVMTYQGLLTDSSGTPYDGVESVVFKIYSGGGGLYWNSGSIPVTFDEGLFSVLLGAPPQPALPSSIFSSDTTLTLGITVGADPEIAPRTRFTSVGYAFQSQHAQRAFNADALGGANLFDVVYFGGWQDTGPYIHELDVTDQVVVGLATPSQPKTTLESHTSETDVFDCAFLAIGSDTANTNIAGIFGKGPSQTVWVLPSALAATASYNNETAIQTYSKNGGTGIYCGHVGDGGIAIDAICGGNSDVLNCTAFGGYSGYFTGGKGMLVDSDSLYGGEFSTDRGSSLAAAVYGHFDYAGSSDGKGVYGYSVPLDFYGYGGYFEGGYMGVRGIVNPTGAGGYYGVYGSVSGGTGTNYGVIGYATGSGTNYGLYSSGNCHVNGTLTKVAGAFRIDHPLDPENKYLQHSFVESTEMKNIYDGVVILDNSGRASVTLPDWFEALNKDFRYQLTCVGGYSPVYIESEISNGSFTIAGGQSGLKVSWQVTGIRHDAYAQAYPIEVEIDKTSDERGLYSVPEVYGKPKTLGIDYVRLKKDRDAQAEQNAALKVTIENKPVKKPMPKAVSSAGISNNN